VLLPIVILTIIKGSPWHFALLLALFTFVGLLEFFAMALPDRKGELLPFALYGALTLFAPLLSDGRLVVMLCAGSFLLTALHFLFRLRDLQTVARDISLVATAYLYIPFLLVHLVLLRLLPDGSSWLLLIMLIVMTNDSAAYYIGSAIGKHRLYPAVSPKKY